MGGNDDGKGEDKDLAVVHRVVHVRPVSGAEAKILLVFCCCIFLYFCRHKAVNILFRALFSIFDEKTSGQLGVVVGHIGHCKDARCYSEHCQDGHCQDIHLQDMHRQGTQYLLHCTLSLGSPNFPRTRQ